MDALFGGMPDAVRFVFAFVVVLGLIVAGAFLWRKFGGSALTTIGSRTRQPRLAVIETMVVDARRRLVLVRRDNAEHLLLIGGPTDVVIEPSIARAVMASRDARGAAAAADLRSSSSLDGPVLGLESMTRPSRGADPSPLSPLSADLSWGETRAAETSAAEMPPLRDSVRSERSETVVRAQPAPLPQRFPAPDREAIAGITPPISLEQALRGPNLPDPRRATPLAEASAVVPEPRRTAAPTVPPMSEPSLQPSVEPRRASAAMPPPLSDPSGPPAEPRRWTVSPLPAAVPAAALQPAAEARRVAPPVVPPPLPEPALQPAAEARRVAPPVLPPPLPEPALPPAPEARRVAPPVLPPPLPEPALLPVGELRRAAVAPVPPPIPEPMAEPGPMPAALP